MSRGLGDVYKRQVLKLQVADLVMPVRGETVFDRAVSDGGAVWLAGAEMYPQRLRRGKAAAHGDHGAVRADGGAGLTAWCAVPGAFPEGGHGSVGGDIAFRRAMGVARPGVAVGQMVRRSELVEDPSLVVLMTEMFGRPPPLAQPGRAALERARAAPVAVTVVTAMKNEGPFILDWIAHHRAVGVSKFLVYTNDCADGTDRLLDLLADAGVVRRDNPYRDSHGGPQHAAFRAAGGEDVVRQADWLLTLDVDEYLNIRAGDGLLPDLFVTVPEAGAISMPWRLFGNGGQHKFEDVPVVQRFHDCAPEYAPRPLQAWAFKTLYRNDGTFGRLGVHRPKQLDAKKAKDLKWLNGNGRDFPEALWSNGWRMTAACWGSDLVGVNHYAVRSAESFLVKRDRGRVNHVGDQQGAAYWFRMNHNMVEDRSIRRLDARVAEERSRLMALPGVAEAHECAVAWHRERIAALKGDAGYAAFYDEITSDRFEALSRMTDRFGHSVFFAGPDVIPDAMLSQDGHAPFFYDPGWADPEIAKAIRAKRARVRG